jgi:GNAT superfamily N-acetyltransferase
VLVLRPAEPADLAGLVAVQVAARAAAPMPAGLHSAAEIHDFLAGRLGSDEVWVAEVDGVVAAYARFTRTWLDDLYVHPDHQRAGLGSALLDLVTSLRPDGFGLWVFESNGPARGFYAKHGLVETERTDGSANEERQPDIRMEWFGG